jgi:DNA recombination protein RmuC
MQPLSSVLNSPLVFVIAMALSFIAGFALAALRSLQKHQTGMQVLTAEKALLEGQLSRLERDLLDLRLQVDKGQQQLQAAEGQKILLDSQKSHLEKEYVRLQQEETRYQERAREMFENMAQKILQEKSTGLRQETEKNIGQLLNPLKERMMEFQKKVEDTYSNESRERFALKEEISRLLDTNNRMSLETTNLTRALKGDVKAQGNWGEVILERLLEGSGLRAGEEYITQGEGLGMKDEEKKSQRPDIIVMLPEDKHLIIDSKVSLVHYEQYVAIDEVIARETSLKNYLQSIYQHIDGLAEKKYHLNDKVKAPEFTLMFMPIEGAFSLAVQSDSTLFSYAWEKSIVLVSPTTLLATLKTVASLWKHERQTQSAQTLALEAGRLYDKFHGFVTDMQKIGETIETSRQVWDESMKKLSTGKGNLVARVEHLKVLGAKNSKDLPKELLE